MHFTLPLLALLGAASATDIAFLYGSATGACTGTATYFSSVGAATCIGGQTGTGNVRFYNVPSGAVGQTYYSTTCSTFAQGGGSGTYCLGGHNNIKAANWFYSSKRLARREEETGVPSTGVKYTTEDGKTRYVKCSPSEFDAVVALVEKKDWAALNALPEDPHAPVLED